MNKNKLNQWLRSSLEDYRPVPGGDSRSKFLEAASAYNKSTLNHRRSRNRWLTGLLLLCLLAISTFFIMPFHQSVIVPPAVTVSSGDKVEYKNASIDNNILEMQADFLPEKTEHQTEQKLISYAELTQPKPDINFDENHSYNINEFNADIEETEKAGNSGWVPEDSIEIQPHKTTLFASIEQQADADSVPAAFEDTVSPVTYDEPLHSSSNGLKTKHLFYSIFYRPEITYNLIESNKLSHSFGVEMQYRFFDDRYSIRTGIGLSISKGYYQYITDYQEFLGAYDHLDSITFAWDQRGYHLLPTYYKSEQEVFEDTLTVLYTNIYKRHYYLQIPLILGYDFIHSKNLRLGLRAGPRLSILSATKTLNQLSDLGRNRIIQINQITSDRIKTNWQFMAGINFGIYSKNHVFYELEPQFTYYFNSVYENPSQQQSPWSLSLRLSVGFR
ncbi:MAG: outer membrane beta-barrel protein [Bacteroidales bacterium]|nr:outer membrane beta-barrel protein [Bacteroidales bacterium]